MTNFEHIPPELIAYSMRAAAACDATVPYVEFARERGWRLDAELVLAFADRAGD